MSRAHGFMLLLESRRAAAFLPAARVLLPCQYAAKSVPFREKARRGAPLTEIFAFPLFRRWQTPCRQDMPLIRKKERTSILPGAHKKSPAESILAANMAWKAFRNIDLFLQKTFFRATGLCAKVP